MNRNDSIQDLRERILAWFPTAKVAIDSANTPTGSSFIDIELDEYPVNVEWRPGKGFGITAGSADGYGTGADEVFGDWEKAFARIVTLLQSKSRTAAPQLVRLRELRELQATVRFSDGTEKPPNFADA